MISCYAASAIHNDTAIPNCWAIVPQLINDEVVVKVVDVGTAEKNLTSICY